MHAVYSHYIADYDDYMLGSVFGRGGTLASGAKVYHHLRHEFEQGWTIIQATPVIIRSV